MKEAGGQFVNSLVAVAALGLGALVLTALAMIGLAIAEWAGKKNPGSEKSGGRARLGGTGVSLQQGDASTQLGIPRDGASNR